MQPHWPDTAVIDGAVCRGCFEEKPLKLFNEDNGERFIRMECTWQFPKCGCDTCKVYCGSEFLHDNRKFTVDDKPHSVGGGCMEVYLTEECSDC